MSHELDYARPVAREPSRALPYFANAALLYPLLVLAALYGQWLLSWYVLGHPPRPSQDDPKDVAGASWMHGITLLALIGFFPAGCAALAFNTLYAIDRRLGWGRTFARAAVLLALWLATLGLMRADPGLVLYWWGD